MLDVIYKVTSKQITKLVKDENFLDLKTNILVLPDYTKVPIWDFNNLIETPDGYCIFTYDEKLTELYKRGIKAFEKAKSNSKL